MDLFILHQQHQEINRKQEMAYLLAGDVMVRSAMLLDQVRRTLRRVCKIPCPNCGRLTEYPACKNCGTAIPRPPNY